MAGSSLGLIGRMVALASVVASILMFHPQTANAGLRSDCIGLREHGVELLAKMNNITAELRERRAAYDQREVNKMIDDTVDFFCQSITFL